MRIVLQKVSRASVRVDGDELGSIGSGLVALVAIEQDDDETTVAAAVDKISNVRCFPDERGRMNIDPAGAGAEFLLISQFTLAARLDRGRRPSFERAAPPAEAEALFDLLTERLRAAGHRTEVGRFGAHMELELVNDGPVTLIVEL